ncbi:monovalent cation/H+ antiporter subunit A [Sphingomonas soli]|uniref:monovalent cation/H+ antiporter subunit A n=1 Tax=Sphingomonas soli TaxID=266127 RepID=UPI000B178FED|nr:monovalent cation/H+ antiporter subunit A [Sphingomonas soli]
MSRDALLWLMLALPFAGSFGAALLPSRARDAAGLLAGAVPLAGAIIAAMLYAEASGGQLARTELEWLPSLGLNLVLRLDGLAWVFAFVILAVGFLVVLYARYYMSPEDPVPRFFSFLLAFMGSMLGLVLSGNLIQIAFFWEMTSLFSFLLIGYWHQNQSARDAARMALIVTGTGGLCLLLGLLLIGKIAGSYDLDVVLASGDLIRASNLYTPALILILLGAATKSAQVPFHFWLPRAMAAPTPVSAYLHSATLVKAGIFVLMRLWPVLAGTDTWYVVVSSMGLATMLFGAWAAMFQQDLKGLLAYSTISHLGLITVLLGLGSPLGLVAAIFHTLNHATFKASLFMAAGIVDHETGTRDLRRLSGLFKFMPITATLAMVAAAAMAGVPLLNGFLSKEMFLAEALENHRGTVIDQALPVLSTLALAFSVLYSVRFIHQCFFGPPPKDLPRQPEEAPPWMRLPIEVLVLACLVIGVVPGLTIGPFLDLAARSVLGSSTPEYSLAIWHGFTMPLLLSLFALVAGTVGYLIFRDQLNRRESPPLMRRVKGRKVFDSVLAAIILAARVIEQRLGTRRLQMQLRLIVVIALLAALLPFLRYGYSLGTHPGTIVDPGFAVIWVVGGACAIGAAWQAKYHRLAALILMAGAGLASCISFVWLSSPDLAVTQLLVETVTTVLLLLGLRWLPPRVKDVWPEGQSPWRVLSRRGADLTVAILAGAGMAALSYAVMTRQLPDTISREFVTRAYPEGGGTNVVNVILVDFRSFDTLGEISVLAIVAITVFALLRRFRPAADSVAPPLQQRQQNAFDDVREDRRVGDTLRDYMLVPRVIMQWLFPVTLLLALYLFIRGHDMPGGGFAAGITLSIGLILQYMAMGARQVESRLRVRPIRWIGTGLLIATATGAGAWLFGYPFLTTWFSYLDLPVVGKVPAATALLFDLGVFILVVGATALILVALGHQSSRTPRANAQPAAVKED